MAPRELADGGKEAVVAVVDDFVARVAADSRINAKFARTDVPRLEAMLVEQVCAATGGPPEEAGGRTHRELPRRTPSVANLIGHRGPEIRSSLQKENGA